jgi:L-glutamine-phosphate cytidylyltransferase
MLAERDTHHDDDHVYLSEKLTMQALILAAGVGKRLGGEIPKALLRVGGLTLIERLVRQLHYLNITQIVVVTGHRHQEIDKILKKLEVHSVFNSYYDCSDNLVSFWVGQEHIHEQCLMAHGDLILEDQVLRDLVELLGDIILPMDRSSVNEESMKIKVVNGRIVNLGKDLPVDEASGESLPLMVFSSKALGELKNITAAIAKGGHSLSLIDEAVLRLINKNLCEVQIHDITGLKWMEIDTPADLTHARKIFGAGTGESHF